MFQDSIVLCLMYFIGDVFDDYGLSSFMFNYIFSDVEGVVQEFVFILLVIIGKKVICYDYIFDLCELGFKFGDNVVYYFEVLDNDGVNGCKLVCINLMIYVMLMEEELVVKIE